MYVIMLQIYVRNQHFNTRISYVLNEKMCFLTIITSSKQKLYYIVKENVHTLKWYLLSPNTALM